MKKSCGNNNPKACLHSRLMETGKIECDCLDYCDFQLPRDSRQLGLMPIESFIPYPNPSTSPYPYQPFATWCNSNSGTKEIKE